MSDTYSLQKKFSYVYIHFPACPLQGLMVASEVFNISGNISLNQYSLLHFFVFDTSIIESRMFQCVCCWLCLSVSFHSSSLFLNANET